MKAIFLSASVPTTDRGNYHETADPFLILVAIREFVTAALGRRHIVWGGHPAITPMISSICEDMGVPQTKAVTLYQSRYFLGDYPKENDSFANVIWTDAVPNDRQASLLLMRQEMLSRNDLHSAVFIGGMEGILDEHDLFTQYHPTATVLTVASTGGATLELAKKLGVHEEAILNDLDYVKMMYSILEIDPIEERIT